MRQKEKTFPGRKGYGKITHREERNSMERAKYGRREIRDKIYDVFPFFFFFFFVVSFFVFVFFYVAVV